MSIAGKIVQGVSGCSVTVLLFAFATWGDFSWVTLTGPITLEPDLGNTEAAGYIASPALQAVIARLFFLLVCFFFCMIPNLAGGLRRHARFLSGLAAAVYLFFSYLLGTFTFFTSDASGASTLRIAVLVVFFVLSLLCRDTSRRTFKAPGFLLRPSFLVPSAGLAIAVGVIVSAILRSPLWLFDEHMDFVLLRLGIFLTAPAGGLAFHAVRRNG